MIFRETAKEDSEYQLMIMRIGSGINVIEPGFLQWGYKIYEDYTVTDKIGDACPEPEAESESTNEIRHDHQHGYNPN